MNDQPTLSRFDYGELSPEIALEIKAAADRVRWHGKRIQDEVAAIGRELLTVKERLNHGQYLRWIESEFQWSEDTATNFTRVAELFREIPNYSEFELKRTVLYILAAPSTPTTAHEEVMGRVKGGESIGVADAKEIVRRHQAEERAEKERQAREAVEHQLQRQKEMLEEKMKRDSQAEAEKMDALLDLQDEIDTLRSEKSDLGWQLAEAKSKLLEYENQELEPLAPEKVYVLPPEVQTLQEAIATGTLRLNQIDQEIDELQAMQQETERKCDERQAERQKELEEMERRIEQAKQRVEKYEENERRKQLASLTKTLRQQIAETIKIATQVGQLTKPEDVKNSKLRSAFVAAIQDAVAMKNLLSDACPPTLEASQESPAIDVTAS